MNSRILIRREKIENFCKKWNITELSLFGSVLRDDFGPESDIDVLVSFAPASQWSLLDHITMEEELSEIMGRKIDLVSKRAIELSPNWIRRNSILSTAEKFYAIG